MYTEETMNVLEALQTNEKRLKEQNKQVKRLIANWDRAFKKLFRF